MNDAELEGACAAAHRRIAEVEDERDKYRGELENALRVMLLSRDTADTALAIRAAATEGGEGQVNEDQLYDAGLSRNEITRLQAAHEAEIASLTGQCNRVSDTADELREQLGRLQDSIGNLAAGLKLSADTSRPSKKSQIEDGCAEALLGLLDPRQAVERGDQAARLREQFAEAVRLPARNWVLVKGYHDSGTINGVYGPYTEAYVDWLLGGLLEFTTDNWTKIKLSSGPEEA